MKTKKTKTWLLYAAIGGVGESHDRPYRLSTMRSQLAMDARFGERIERVRINVVRDRPRRRGR